MDNPREQQTKGTWKMFVGLLKEAWGDLTDDDLDRYEGQRDQLEGHIERKTGQQREDIQRRIDNLANEARYEW